MAEINTESIKGEDSQPVLAYRVGQLEKSSREGFQKLSDKLDTMAYTFATHKDVESAQLQAKMEYDAIYNELEDIKLEIDALRKQKVVQNILAGVLGSVLSLLLAYVFHNALGF